MKLSKEQLEMLAGLNFGSMSMGIAGKLIALKLLGTRFTPSDPIPLTHFEILKLDAVFMDVRDGEMQTGWSSDTLISNWRYCLTIDYIGAVTPEDVVWLKLERGA